MAVVDNEVEVYEADEDLQTFYDTVRNRSNDTAKRFDTDPSASVGDRTLSDGTTVIEQGVKQYHDDAKEYRDDAAIYWGGDGTTSGGDVVPEGQGFKDWWTAEEAEADIDVNTSAGTNPNGTLPYADPDGVWRITLGTLGSTFRVYPLAKGGASADGFRLEITSGGAVTAESISSGASTPRATSGPGTLSSGDVLLLYISGNGGAFSLEKEGGSGEIIGTNTGYEATWGSWGITNNTAAPRVARVEYTGDAATAAGFAPNDKLEAVYGLIGEIGIASAAAEQIMETDGSGGLRLVDKPSGSGGGGGGTVVATPGAAYGRPVATGREALADAAARLAMSRATRAGNATSEVVFVMFGDSQCSRYPLSRGLRDALLAAGIPDAYGRFVSMDQETTPKGPLEEHDVSFTGTWAESDVYAQDYAGPARKIAVGSSAGSSKMTVTADAGTPDWGADSRILYRVHAGGGSFRWRVDGGSWTTVNTSTGTADSLGEAAVSSGGLLEIEVTSGSVTLSGVVLRSASKRGFSIMKAGNGGSRIDQHDNATVAHTQRHLQVFGTQSVVVVMSIGGNDVKVAITDDGETAAEAATNTADLFGPLLDTFAEVRLGTNPVRGVPVLYVGIGDADTDPTITDAMIELSRQALYAELAERSGTAFVDARQVLGEWSAGAYTDELHFNDAGGRLLMEAAVSLLGLG